MHQIATLSMEFPSPASGEASAVPEWLQFIPAGEFRGRDGRGPWKLSNPAGVIEASNAAKGRGLPIDEAHAIDLGAPSGQRGRAVAWIKELEAREGSLWGRVAWNREGKALMEDQAYSGISPTFAYAEDGTVLQLLRAALTNVPNLPQLATLNHQDQHIMDLLAQLRQLHGLAADADPAACLNACRTDRTSVLAHGTALNAIATAAGLAAGLDASSLASSIGSKLAGAGDATEMRTKMVAMQSELTGLKGDRAKEKAEAFIDGAMAAGKPIPKTLRDHYIARHAADPAAVEIEIGGMVSLNAGGVRVPPADGGGDRSAKQIAMQAQQLQDKERLAGREMTIAEAVSIVQQEGAAA